MYWGERAMEVYRQPTKRVLIFLTWRALKIRTIFQKVYQGELDQLVAKNCK